MLGIIIGVGSVIALMAVGQGSQKAVSEQILGLGSNLLFVRPGSSSAAGVQGGAGTAQTLSTSDSDAIAGSVANVAAIAPELDVGLQVSASGQNTFTRVAGVTPDYATVLNLALAGGDFIADSDLTASTRVVVLGSAVAQQLFPNADPVGQQVRVAQGGNNIVTLKVIGVLQSKGGDASTSADDRIFLPLTTVQRQLSNQRGAQNTARVSQITVQVANKDALTQAKADITNVVSQNHKVVTPDFTVENQDDLAAAASQVGQTLTVLLGSIAGISLVVGGIGIMNIMLVSVTERTREIGIRKAVGAQGSDILLQFLTEALTVTALGGLIGVIAGVGGAELLNGRTIAGLGNNVQTAISWTSVALAFAVSAGVGVFFGIYPAQRAANLRPIEALRYE
jgi:putative ABC transport system permease protein